MTIIKLRRAAAIAVGCLGLTACTQSEVRMSPDFGQAVRQDTMAQIADPDAHYTGDPAPGSLGSRVSLAQKRYNTGQVIQPSISTAITGATVADNGAQAAPEAAGAAAGVSNK